MEIICKGTSERRQIGQKDSGARRKQRKTKCDIPSRNGILWIGIFPDCSVHKQREGPFGMTIILSEGPRLGNIE
jgi:hypothetical protein